MPLIASSVRSNNTSVRHWQCVPVLTFHLFVCWFVCSRNMLTQTILKGDSAEWSCGLPVPSRLIALSRLSGLQQVILFLEAPQAKYPCLPAGFPV